MASARWSIYEHIHNAARMSEISRILPFKLLTLQNYKLFKTQNKSGRKSLRKLLRFSFYPFSLQIRTNF